MEIERAFLLMLFLVFGLSSNAQISESGIRMIGTELLIADAADLPDTTKTWYGFEYTGPKTTCYEVSLSYRLTDSIEADEGLSLYYRYQITTNRGAPDLLIRGIQRGEHETVLSHPLLVKELFPGEKIQFEFDQAYTLMAFGDGPRKRSQKEGTEGVTNYKIVLKGESDHVQTIIASKFFDSNFYKIFWIGDLDNDNRPDLLMTTSHKYVSEDLTLFLSSMAKGPDYIAPATALSLE